MQESRGREIHFNAGDLLFNFAQHDSMSHKATPETFFNMVVEGTNFAWTFTKNEVTMVLKSSFFTQMI